VRHLVQVLAQPANRDAQVLGGLGRGHPGRAVHQVEALGQGRREGVEVRVRRVRFDRS
jgi:hypothetical protein